jgi:hypothetical protein
LARRAFNIADLDDPAKYRLATHSGQCGLLYEEVR